MRISSIVCRLLKCPSAKDAKKLAKESKVVDTPSLEAKIKPCIDTITRGNDGKPVFDSEDIFVSSLGKFVPHSEVIGLEDAAGLRRLNIAEKVDYIDL